MGNLFVRDGVVGHLSPLLFLQSDKPIYFDRNTGMYHLMPESEGSQVSTGLSVLCARGGAYNLPAFLILLGGKNPRQSGHNSEEK
ncbi:MAG: hypothetical protein HY362_02880 [Candidatus Aenigmarchaeota archaeon]|nr:hypothetical protein [Candidatus Aenigmarchaeota archaeon]